MNNIEILNKLSASAIEPPISYVFFINIYARYIADCFIVEHQNKTYLLTTLKIFDNLIKHIKKFDLRSQFEFEITDLKVYYSDIGLQDPRGLLKIYLSDAELDTTSDELYKELKINNQIAEFDDFVFERSILFEYNAQKYINNTQCFLGQEAWNNLSRMNIASKLYTSKNHENLDHKILCSINDLFLIKK